LIIKDKKSGYGIPGGERGKKGLTYDNKTKRFI